MGRNVNLFKRIRPVACSLIMAAVLLAATGCEEIRSSLDTVKFRAVAQEPADTKAVFSGTNTTGTPKKAIIWWEDGDAIRIYSDKATCPGGEYHWADYLVTPRSSDNSLGDITASPDHGGLQWAEGSDTHTFIGVYPAPDTPELTVGGEIDKAYGSGNRVSFEGSIPGWDPDDHADPVEGEIQTGALREGTTIFYPSNVTMRMTAYSSMTKPAGGNASLEFNPAFTSFRINAGTDTDMTIMSVDLSAAANPIAGVAANPIAGEFTGDTYTGSQWNYSTSASNPNTKVRLTLGEGGYRLTTDKTVDIVLLALPISLTELTLAFNVKIGESETVETRILDLKPATGDDWITFNACKQAYLKGLIVPGSVWTINDDTPIIMREEVSPWNTNEQGITYGGDPIINATKLEGSNPYVFSVNAPISGEGNTYKWRVKVLNESRTSVATGVTLTQLSQGTSTSNVSSDGVLEGNQPSDAADVVPIEVRVTGATGIYYLTFSVIGPDGREFSINSEVARSEEGFRITL